MGRALKATINTAALKHNLQCVKQKASASKVLAMVKANGYGHGIVNVAKTLSNADALGVACIEEAIKLREAGIQNRIVLIEGFFHADEFGSIIRLQLEPVIHHKTQLAALLEFDKRWHSLYNPVDENLNDHLDLALNPTNTNVNVSANNASASDNVKINANNHVKMNANANVNKTGNTTANIATPLKIWIKVDTGMHRLGFPVEEFEEVYRTLKNLKSLDIQAVITHFASADEETNPKTKEQIAYFQETVKNISEAKSLANSAGIWQWPESHADWVRPGIVLYGVSPFANQTGADLGLIPAMTLSTELIAVHWVKKGEKVGYGGIYTCDEDMPVGVVAVGYADGYPRLAPHNTPVLLNGKRVPLVGRVSMDMLTVDLRTQPHAKVGDAIELWGENLPVEEVAGAIGTLGYELLTSLSNRVPIFLE